jgi:cytochrome P450
MHRNPDIFPEPMKFDPERWLNPEDAQRLERHMVPFERESTMCVGMPRVLFATLYPPFSFSDNPRSCPQGRILRTPNYTRDPLPPVP